MAKPIFIKVDGPGEFDPAAGTNDCNIPYLKGMDIYLDNVPPSLYTVLSTGGFRMIAPFVADAEFYVQLSGISYGTAESSYTNGFCLSRIMATLFGRIGWYQQPGADQPVLNATNLISKSGRKFNDGSFHSLVTLSTIQSTMEQNDADDAAFNAFLEMYQRGIILKCLNGVFNPPELIQQSLLFTRWGYNDAPIPNTGKFIGVRIKVPPLVDMAVQINSVALMFDDDVTFNLYLFNDAKMAPVWIGSVSAVANEQTIVNLTDMVLNHIGSANHGGIFYLGYFQNDLGLARAIRENSTTVATGKVYHASMIEATAIGSNNFDRQNVGYSAYQTYGINPFFTVFRDHTTQIEKTPSLFDNLIGLQGAAQTIELGLYTQRSNTEERKVKDQAQTFGATLDLMGVAPISESPQTIGLRKLIMQETERVKKSFFPQPKPTSIPLC